VECFNAKLLDELVTGEIFYALAVAVIEQRRKYSSAVCTHSSLCYRQPVPEFISWPTSPDSLRVARSAIPALVETRPLN
jgi:hypothetical protein